MNRLYPKYDDDEFKDKPINIIWLGQCIDCSKEYSLNVDEIIYFKDKGYPLPKRCVDCRRIKKERSQNESYNRNRTSWTSR